MCESLWIFFPLVIGPLGEKLAIKASRREKSMILNTFNIKFSLKNSFCGTFMQIL